VNAASEVGLRNLYDILRRGGLTTLNKPFYEYGLPLILGAGEVRLTELTNLYASLARGGEYRPAATLLNLPEQTGVRLLSPEASYLLADILVDLRRPDLPESWRASVTSFPVAWKTGTSYGRRDAWAVGYTRDYTVGVWAGNCSGEGSVDIVGASMAAPVMFDVFRGIVNDPDRPWFEAPPLVGTRQVCAVSGQPAGNFCDETVTESFLIGRSPSATCSVHRPIFVDKRSGLRLRASCTDSREYYRPVVEVWPPRIASWLVNNGRSKPLPPYDPGCMAFKGGDRPSIISPENGSIFELTEAVPVEYQKIRLEASIPSGDGIVHWFLDGRHLAEVQAGEEMFLVPTPGRHKLLCLDASGRSSTSVFEVD
jgi:penicillin-binding protein 1C